MEKMERLLISNNEDYIELKDISKIKNNNLLLNISSNDILKYMFSYLKYSSILKLIKYNKLIQNKIGFNKQNYVNYSNTKIIIKKGKIPYYYYIKEEEILRVFAIFDLLWIFFYISYKKRNQKELNNNILMEIANKILYILIYFNKKLRT